MFTLQTAYLLLVPLFKSVRGPYLTTENLPANATNLQPVLQPHT